LATFLSVVEKMSLVQPRPFRARYSTTVRLSMAQAKASDYQLDADATKNEIPDQVQNDNQEQLTQTSSPLG